MLSVVSQAWNSWKSAKGVALLAILALAIGIGSATAIYTVVHTVLLKPLPYHNGDGFVALYGAVTNEPGKKNGMSDGYLRVFQQHQRSFDVFGWFTVAGSFNLTSPGEPQHIDGVRVTPSLIDSLGVKPYLGRWFGEAKQENGNSNLAVLAYPLWRRLGGRKDILGQSVVLDGTSYLVTGVAPAWFHFPLFDVSGEADRNFIWIPISPQYVKSVGDAGLFLSYARRKPGISFELASQDVKRCAAELARDNPVALGRRTAFIEPLQAAIGSNIRPTLLLLLAAAGLLLLITCANVSGLLVTRAVTRSRETAIRLALGAAQGQMTLQYLSESLIVSLVGAAASIAFSYFLLRAVLALIANYVPLSDQITVDWNALAFAIAVALVASFLTILAPLWHALRTAPNEVLSEGVRASGSLRSRRLSQGLVIGEIALAFTLLAAGALLIAQINRLSRVSTGFDPDHLLTFQMTITDPRYADGDKMLAYREQIQQALATLPGVTNAGLATALPLTGCCFTTAVFPEGRTLSQETVLATSFQVSSPGYFATMRIPLLAGRVLSERDAGQKVPPVMINQAAAKRFWGRSDPVGAYARLGDAKGSRVQIIGVVGDVRNDGLSNPPVPELYMVDVPAIYNWLSGVVRSDLPERALAPEIRRAIHQVNTDQPIFNIQPMNEIARDSLTLQRATSLLTILFACAACLLAALGVYGVVAYSVRQRTVEFGTRMALGAVSKDLLRLVLGGGLKMAVGGLVLGALAVVGITILLVKSSVIHAVEPSPYVYSTLAIGGIALLASLYPAWRATQLSPMVAIRNDPETMWLRTSEQIRRVAGEISDLFSHEHPAQEIAEGELLSSFVDATRSAATSENALETAVITLAETLGGESALLLERVSERTLRTAARFPAALPEMELTTDGFLLRRLQAYSLPLPFTEADLASWQNWAVEHKPDQSAEIANLKQAHIRLAVVLRTAKEMTGLLLLGPRFDDNDYSQPARKALRACADQLALMIENRRLTDRVVEQEKLRRDLALAVEVQRRLLPEAYPESSFGDVAAFTLPVRSVGGDYYDFVKVGEHGLGIALADVAGKGIAAALIMSVVQASLRILSAEGNITLPELVSKMNRFLHRSTGFNSYATFFYAQVDEQSGQLRYVNAGHNPPYLLRAAEVEELKTGGMVIGMFAQATYEEAKVDLRSGDVLVAFTDGVTEALNTNEEEYGEERLKELLKSVMHLPVGEMSTRITAALREWIGDAPQHDDLTFLVLKVK
jgi:predicted permease